MLALALVVASASVGQALGATPTVPPFPITRPRASASASAHAPPHSRWSKTATVEKASPSTCVSNEGTASVDSPDCRALARSRRPHVGLGLGTVFLQPIGQAGSPPALLGAELRGFVSLPVGPSVDLRLGPNLAISSSTHGVVAPLGLQVEPLFILTPEVFWGLSLTAGVLVGPRYLPAPDQPKITPSPFALVQLIPFGFRFGERSQGELGVKFGLMASGLDRGHDRSWAVSFGSASVWLGYAFPARP